MYLMQDNPDIFTTYSSNVRNEGQSGGGKVKFKHDNHTFILYKDEDEDNIHFSIHNKNVEDTADICAYIIIPKKERVAIIQGISAMSDCTVEGFPKTKRGSIILQGVLAFITSIKDKYKLKRILIKDNSFFQCEGFKKNIKGSSLYMFTHGITWYHKYGFYPYDNNTNGLHIKNYVNLLTNNKILTTIPIRCTHLETYLRKAVNQLKLNSTFTDDAIRKMIDRFANRPIIDFFKMFLTNFDLTCGLFNIISSNLIDELGLTDLHGISYVKPLTDEPLIGTL